MFQKSIPVLPALNIKKTIEFYQKKLDFNPINYGNYAILTYKEVELHFFQTDDLDLCRKSGCYIRVKNIEDLYSSLSVSGTVHPNGQLEEKSWGMKEFAILDNNGNLIRFGEKK